MKLGDTGFNPVLQVIQVRRKAEIGLTLGDGEKFIEAVLPPNIAPLVSDGHIQESSYVTVTSFFCTTVDHKAVLILMGLEVYEGSIACTAPSGSHSKELEAEDDEDLPVRLGRKSKSFGQGSRDWFDAMPTLLNSSLSKEIAKAKADGADIEKVLPLLMQGKLYDTIRAEVAIPETQKGIFDYDPSAPDDAPVVQRKTKESASTDEISRRSRPVPVSRQSLGAAPARSSVTAAVKSRQSVGAAPRVLKKAEPEHEEKPQEEEKKKRGLLTRLFGIGKSHDSGPKGISRSVSVGTVKGKSAAKGKSKVGQKSYGRDDDDDVAPPPEEDYPSRRK